MLFGINMTKFIKDHEAEVENKLELGIIIDDLFLEKHKARINIIQHERLIHLIVTFMTVVAFLISLLCCFIIKDFFEYMVIVSLILFILVVAYLKHYFFLENHTQYWYVLLDRLQSKVND